VSIALGQVAHFSLAVTEPTRAGEWWRSLFDLEEWARSAKRVVLGNDAIAISLIKGVPDPSALTHMAFRTKDMASLKSARDFLRDKGVALEDPRQRDRPRGRGLRQPGSLVSRQTTATVGSCTCLPKTSHELTTRCSVLAAMIGA